MVVLPEPLEPSRPKISPGFTENDRSLITVLVPKRILRCLTSTTFIGLF